MRIRKIGVYLTERIYHILGGKTSDNCSLASDSQYTVYREPGGSWNMEN